MQPRTSVHSPLAISQIPETVDYIRNQAKHHATRSFTQEWKMFLKKHGLVEEQD
jgi:hypothetical protein